MLDQNKVSDAVLNMYDIRDALSKRTKNKPLHDDTGSDYSVGDCIGDVILFLESLEEEQSSHMMSCPSYKSGNEDDCLCKPS